MLDLKAVHRRLGGDDGFEQRAQGGDVLLPVAEQIQQAPPRLRLIDVESLVERAARCHDVNGFVLLESLRRSGKRCASISQFKDSSGTQSASSTFGEKIRSRAAYF
ncbi:hypothetical protein NFO65_26700 [Neorhizobium galegae]|nr:hypothetical protein [Neorhizobium galegae]MCQ1574320.1 hypothetical protein [Neorhizobium galegae]MCQ1837700.1 hypothetical protein [Neorhizobium galegae]